MVRGYGAEDGYWDIRAVRQIAAVLLDLKPGAEPAGGLRLDAYNFVYRSTNVVVNELLNVCTPLFERRPQLTHGLTTASVPGRRY